MEKLLKENFLNINRFLIFKLSAVINYVTSINTQKKIQHWTFLPRLNEWFRYFWIISKSQKVLADISIRLYCILNNV